jgi:peptide/nickel transport system ATP-binding protein
LLEICNLKTYYYSPEGTIRAVDGVSLKLEKGKALALVGESGCGKTTIALSIMRILPKNAKIIEGKILLEGENLVNKTDSYMNNIRWKRISLVFQGALNALNPMFKVGDQISEAMSAHDRSITKQLAKEKTLKLLELVGLPESTIGSYPHELSGGMKQRAVIAMALSCDPDILIADEPTTALDVITQAQILKLIKELQVSLGLSIILITHDLSLPAEICTDISIVYAGRIVEYGDIGHIYTNPMHPYTIALVNAFPSITGPMKKRETLPGFPPDLRNPPIGCRLFERCPYARQKCRKENPELEEVKKGHFVACHII